MPIYEYRCESCGHEQEFLRKISDPPVTDCPSCGKATMVKKVTAAGFQLKGSGWYVTDFRNNNAGGAAAKKDSKPVESGGGEASSGASDASKSDAKTESKSETKTESKAESKSESKPASSGGSDKQAA